MKNGLTRKSSNHSEPHRKLGPAMLPEVGRRAVLMNEVVPLPDVRVSTISPFPDDPDELPNEVAFRLGLTLVKRYQQLLARAKRSKAIAMSKTVEQAYKTEFGTDPKTRNESGLPNLPFEKWYYMILGDLDCDEISEWVNGVEIRRGPFSLSSPRVIEAITLACKADDWVFLERLVERNKRYRKTTPQGDTRARGKLRYEPRNVLLIRNWVRLHGVDPSLPGLCWFTRNGQAELIQQLEIAQNVQPLNGRKSKKKEPLAPVSQISALVSKLGLEDAKAVFSRAILNFVTVQGVQRVGIKLVRAKA